MTVGGQIMGFMVGTGAKHLVVTQRVAPLSQQLATIVGATGSRMCWAFLMPRGAPWGSWGCS